MQAVPARLGTWDYVTGSAVVAVASCIGIYQIFSARKSRNITEFLVHNHDLGIVPLILSIAATASSAVGLLGYPTETYIHGVSFLVVCLSFIFLIPFGAFLYLPVFYNLGVSSVFEYLELRFSRSVRLCASIINTLKTIMYASCVMYAPALALNQVTGLHIWASVGSIGFICIIYTSMGGIKAIVWADVTQYLVMIFVFLVILIKGTADQGNISEVWRICSEGMRTQFFIFTESPYSAYSFWTMAIGGTIHFLAIQVTNQYYMQRYLCNRTLRGAKISFIGGCVTIAFFMSIVGMGGLVMYARYHTCDPLRNGQVTSRDQIMALFAVETLGFCDGLSGVFVAAVLCATLSTQSSLMNGITSVTMEDYINPCFPNLTQARQIKISKIVGIVYGAICVTLVVVAQNIEGVIRLIFTITGATGGPILTIFTVGMALPWVNSWGAIAGFLTGFVLAIWASIGSLVTKQNITYAPFSTSGCPSQWSHLNQTDIVANYSTFAPLTNSTITESDVFAIIYNLQSLWYTIVCLGIGSVVSIAVSIMTGPQLPRELDPKLIFPITKSLCSYLPKRYQEFLGYDVEVKEYIQVAMTDTSLWEKQNLKKIEGDSSRKYENITRKLP